MYVSMSRDLALRLGAIERQRVLPKGQVYKEIMHTNEPWTFNPGCGLYFELYDPRTKESFWWAVEL